MVRPIACLSMVLLLGVTALAQGTKPKFEVTSIKPQQEPLTGLNAASGVIPRALPGGRFNHSHLTVQSLLLFAYELKPYQIAGAPDWVSTDRFAIDAKAAGDVPPDQIKLMVQSLLEDRFKLVTHTEPRDMRFQALVRTRPDGPLGPDIFRMDDECVPATVIELRRKFPEKYRSPAGNMTSSCTVSGLNTFADYLFLRLGVPVIDATGLKGPYYYVFAAQLPPASFALGRPLNDPSDLPALSTALREQLGLKLEARKGPVDVLVIDSVSQPTEN